MVISAVGTRTVEIDLIDFYHNEVRMLGADSRKLDCVRSAERLSRFSPYFEAGDLHPLPIARTFTLEQGRNAYSAVAGRPPGRVVICPESALV
ncbi:hypothetical protein Acor_29250 [Acrocarpospora corrugata]|uniref:Alcohol dehydrogenase-like C-terminal domain-containing protein n=1 Tax=Acrocarpospora corrugata TaxID=35763 RepID=A0A5M3W164_9ACTN|nr:hypothetical protein [Acrocarpospora corrugata]GES00861.1 hypothetical protein Acor_29250 [Acrocarpospora corrugata]